MSITSKKMVTYYIHVYKRFSIIFPENAFLTFLFFLTFSRSMVFAGIDDFVTSAGKAVDDPAVFGNSWKVNVGGRRQSTVSIATTKHVGLTCAHRKSI